MLRLWLLGWVGTTRSFCDDSAPAALILLSVLQFTLSTPRQKEIAITDSCNRILHNIFHAPIDFRFDTFILPTSTRYHNPIPWLWHSFFITDSVVSAWQFEQLQPFLFPPSYLFSLKSNPSEQVRGERRPGFGLQPTLQVTLWNLRALRASFTVSLCNIENRLRHIAGSWSKVIINPIRSTLISFVGECCRHIVILKPQRVSNDSLEALAWNNISCRCRLNTHIHINAHSWLQTFLVTLALIMWPMKVRTVLPW